MNMGTRQHLNPPAVWATVTECTIYDETNATVMRRHHSLCRPGMWSVGIVGAERLQLVRFFAAAHIAFIERAAVVDDFGDLVPVLPVGGSQ